MTPFIQAKIAFPAARPGESWTITLAAADGTGTALVKSWTILSTDTDETLAAKFSTLLSTAGYTATADHALLNVTGAAAFTVAIAVTPSGAATAGPAVFSHTIVIESAFAATDDWKVFLTETNDAAIASTTAAGSTNTDTIAGNLAAAINTVSGFHAIAEGRTLTVTRTSGADFKLALQIDAPSQGTQDTATVARIVSIGTVASSDTFRLTVGGTPYESTANTAALVAEDLAGQIDDSDDFTATWAAD